MLDAPRLGFIPVAQRGVSPSETCSLSAARARSLEHDFATFGACARPHVDDALVSRRCRQMREGAQARVAVEATHAPDVDSPRVDVATRPGRSQTTQAPEDPKIVGRIRRVLATCGSLPLPDEPEQTSPRPCQAPAAQGRERTTRSCTLIALLAAAATECSRADAQPRQAPQLASRDGKLRPPAKESIAVAFVITDGATVIDFAGPWESSRTWW